MTTLEIAGRLQHAIQLDRGIFGRDLNCAQRAARILIPVVEQIIRKETKAKLRDDEPNDEFLKKTLRR